MSAARRRLAALGLGFLAAAALACGAELAFRFLFSRGYGFPVEDWPGHRGRLDLRARRVPPDSARLGSTLVMLPAVSHRSIMETREGKVLWDIPVEVDRLHRRVTPGEERKRARRFLLLFGDSFIEGTGLRQEETLAYYLGRRLPTQRVYNYGISGMHMGEALDWIREIRPEDLGARRGTILVFFSDFYLKRNAGALSMLRRRVMGDKPRHRVGKGGRIEATETWAQSRPIWCAFARFAWSLGAVRYFRADWPWAPSREDYVFQTEILRQMRDEAERLGADDFRVVLAPWRNGRTRDLVPFLEAAGIPYLDFSHWRLSQLTRGPAWLWDGHASPESQSLLAAALATEVSR